jgi:transcriptional regulator with XRE-family HTH domain
VKKPVIRVWLTEFRGNRTHQEVSDLAGVSRNYYTEIENGVKNPSVETAKKLAEALEFDWTLFFRTDSRVKQQIII